ncbi:MAG: acyl-CoA dehydrogenase [Deltaproteobacteria bacterium HGW-Deltaproteobacteria-12]|jgi:acyl-CoA dehydrogenase|nr:MAG: acyl-CoA dehydrogenase [Deltaproteobacteria bacterium HGW-Deltaproteobacteria-12]
MYEEYFSESHQMLRESLRKFIAREITPFVDTWEEEGTFPRELYKKAGDAGFLGIGSPEEYGGTPGDIFHTVAYTEEVMRCGSVGLSSSLGCSAIAVPPILALGTEEQKMKYVPPVLAGDQLAVLGITEPSGGSDVASLLTKAVRKGDKYIVNGSKTFITSGTRADYVTTAVRTGGPGHAGISLLIIEKGTPGFTVSKKIDKMGWLASDTAELSFDDCEVPVKNLIGEENRGFYGIMLNFQKERLYLAVQGYAVAEYALELAVKYAKERVAFGKPIVAFQVTRHKLAEMATLVEAAKQFTYRVAAMIGTGQNAYKDVCMAKNFATKACDRVVYDAVQIHGGYGYCKEYMVERLYRDSRLFSIGGGTYEIMNEVISKQLGL